MGEKKTARQRFLMGEIVVVAEGVGFEPTVPCDTPVFKTGALNHSATPPQKEGHIMTWRSQKGED